MFDVSNAQDSLQAAVDGQLERVSVAAKQDLPVARAAAGAALVLSERLRLGPFIDLMLADAKPRLLLRFCTGPGCPWPEDEVLLKIYGDAPRGEGPLQSRWAERGVHTVPVEYGRQGPCSWILMPKLPLRHIRPTKPEDWHVVTEALAVQAGRLHEEAPELSGVLRPLDVVMLPRLHGAVARLERAGVEPPVGWECWAAEAYSPYGVPLHGDLALTNVGLDREGCLVVYDASALLGPLAFDAVRWAARATSAAVPPNELLARWAAHEPLPPPNVLDRLLAVECLLEAGSRCAVAERSGGDPARIAELLETARRFAP
jgi:hypothetical protein